MRLKTDGELLSALDDLRAARTLLRNLPKRRAPRNFTLTRRMVGLNPPLPRSYPAFRFVTAAATLLFFFTFGINTLAPQLAQAPALGMGGGGGPAESESFANQSAPAGAPAGTEAPALAEAPATEAPAPAAADLAPQPTMTPMLDSIARVADTPVSKSAEPGTIEVQSQPQVEGEAHRPVQFIPSMWLTAFAIIAIAGVILMAVMRRSSSNRWK